MCLELIPIRQKDADPDADPHHFGNLDPHPDPDPHQIKIRIRIKVISWSGIRFNLRMTS
jgi:hypothetical protein